MQCTFGANISRPCTHVELITSGMSILFSSKLHLPFRLHTPALPFVPFLLFPYFIYSLQTTWHKPLLFTPFPPVSFLIYSLRTSTPADGALFNLRYRRGVAVLQRQARASLIVSASASTERLVHSVSHSDGVDPQAIHARPSAVATL